MKLEKLTLLALMLMLLTTTTRGQERRKPVNPIKLAYKYNYNTTFKYPDFVERYECPYLPFCRCTRDTLTCEDFARFGQLDFEKNSLFQRFVFNHVRIRPQNRTKLSGADRLTLKGIRMFSRGTIELANVEFDRTAPLGEILIIDQIISPSISLTLRLVDSTYDYETCEPASAANSSIQLVKILQLEDVVFKKPICPWFFDGANLGRLYVVNSNSADCQAQDTFRFNASSDANVSATIQELVGDRLSISDLDRSSFLHESVFKKLQRLYLNEAAICNFDSQAFDPAVFAELQSIFFNSARWDDLKYSTLLEPVDLTRKIPVVIGEQIVTDDNFCKFYGLQHSRIFIADVFSDAFQDSANCSCTLMWLLEIFKSFPDNQESARKSSDFQMIRPGVLKRTSLFEKCAELLDFMHKSCNFEERADKCSPEDSQTDSVDTEGGEIAALVTDASVLETQAEKTQQVPRVHFKWILIGLFVGLCVLVLLAVGYFFLCRKEQTRYLFTRVNSNGELMAADVINTVRGKLRLGKNMNSGEHKSYYRAMGKST